MKSTKVIQLGLVRDLFAQWDAVREHFRSQKVHGFQISLIGDDGKETIYLGGVYRQDQTLALRASLKMSAARMQVEDEPLGPDFRASNF